MADKQTSHNTFSVREAIGYSWKSARKNFWFFARIILIGQVISWLFDYVSNTWQESNDTNLQILGVLIFIIGWIISIEISFAQLAVFLKSVDKKKTELKDLFAYFDA